MKDRQIEQLTSALIAALALHAGTMHQQLLSEGAEAGITSKAELD